MINSVHLQKVNLYTFTLMTKEKMHMYKNSHIYIIPYVSINMEKHIIK